MKFNLDWNIPVWQLITVIWAVLVFVFVVVRKLDKLIAIFEEFPPHRHVPGAMEPIYPKGMRPSNGD